MQVYFSVSFGFHPTQDFFKLYLGFQNKKKGEKKPKKGRKKEGFHSNWFSAALIKIDFNEKFSFPLPTEA